MSRPVGPELFRILPPNRTPLDAVQSKHFLWNLLIFEHFPEQAVGFSKVLYTGRLVLVAIKMFTDFNLRPADSMKSE